jgi:hypothetical protein
MLTRSLLLLSLSGFLLAGGAAKACPPPLPTFVVFDANSSVLPRDRVETLRDLVRIARVVPAKCSSLELRGYVDSSENGDLVVGRTDTIKRFLVSEGALEETVSARVEPVPIAPSRGSPYSRAVTVRRTWAVGQWRCDPASKSEGSQTACAPIYAHCYLVLADGAICNVFEVPDPGPLRYSVDPNGKKLD